MLFYCLTKFDVNSLALRLVIVNIFSIILHKQIAKVKNDCKWLQWYNNDKLSMPLLNKIFECYH